MSSPITAEDQKYNGWANYETWCVNLWLSNDCGLYELTRELVADVVERAEPSTVWNLEEARRFNTANALKDFVEALEEVENVTERASFVSDLLRSALSEVDWTEIAEAWLEDAIEA